MDILDNPTASISETVFTQMDTFIIIIIKQENHFTVFTWFCNTNVCKWYPVQVKEDRRKEEIPRHHVQDILHAERYIFFTSIYKHSHERRLLMVLLNIGFRALFMLLLYRVHLCELQYY